MTSPFIHTRTKTWARRLCFMVMLFVINIVAYAQSGPVNLTSLKPTKSIAFKPAKEYLFGKMTMGGVAYTNGFGLRILQGPTQYGYAEYSLKGKYSKITFILGTSPSEGHAPGQYKGVFKVSGDGNTLLDNVIREYSTPERITLDVSGVDILRFEILTGDVTVGIVEPWLWTSGQTPSPKGKLTNATKKTTHLAKELSPYVMSNAHKEVGPECKVKSVNISGVEYDNGILMNTNQQIIGAGTAWTEFNLGSMYKQLKMTFGPVKTGGGTLGRAWLTVRSNGKVIAEYEIEEDQLAKEVILDIDGCNQLTIESEQDKGSSSIAVVNMLAYPEGSEPQIAQNEIGKETIASDQNLKHLPDVCKLISNIPPYVLAGINDADEKCLFDGKSQHITFSMGGTRFWEGIVLQSSTSLFNNNTMAHAIFNLAGEFDYLSFTVGWVGKCGVLKNDRLKIYADDTVVLDMPLMGTAPNQHIIVPLHKCRKLTIEKQGMTSLDHPAFGVADMVVYRGEPVENNLFVHPRPEMPDEIDLIDLGVPYIHYVKGLALNTPKFLDGSLKKNYYTLLDGQRVNKGFLLSTSVHFDLEMGPLGGDGGGTGIVAGAIGSAVLVGAVGGAAITAISPFGAFLALAAGGTAHESSCAAFNTYGEYDQVTFTVVNTSKENNYEQKSKLLIGGDHEVLHEIELDINAGPTTFTLPINKCHQLMFWLQCGDWGSPNYLFYDIKVTKGEAATAVHSAGSTVDGNAARGNNVGAKAANMSGLKAPIAPYEMPLKSVERKEIAWEKPQYMRVQYIDEYFAECKQIKYDCDRFLGTSLTELTRYPDELIERVYRCEPGKIIAEAGYYSPFKTRAIYVTGSDGNNYRKIELTLGQKAFNIADAINYNTMVIRMAKSLKQQITLMKLSQTNANLSLPELGLGAIAGGKLIKAAANMLKGYSVILDAVIDEKTAEIEALNSLAKDAINNADFVSTDGTFYVL